MDTFLITLPYSKCIADHFPLPSNISHIKLLSIIQQLTLSFKSSIEAKLSLFCSQLECCVKYKKKFLVAEGTYCYFSRVPLKSLPLSVTTLKEKVKTIQNLSTTNPFFLKYHTSCSYVQYPGIIFKLLLREGYSICIALHVFYVGIAELYYALFGKISEIRELTVDSNLGEIIDAVNHLSSSLHKALIPGISNESICEINLQTFERTLLKGIKADPGDDTLDVICPSAQLDDLLRLLDIPYTSFLEYEKCKRVEVFLRSTQNIICLQDDCLAKHCCLEHIFLETPLYRHTFMTFKLFYEACTVYHAKAIEGVPRTCHTKDVEI